MVYVYKAIAQIHRCFSDKNDLSFGKRGVGSKNLSTIFPIASIIGEFIMVVNTVPSPIQ